MKNQHIIDNLIFGFNKYISEENFKGHFYLGSIPSQLKTDNKYTAICKVNNDINYQKKTTWGCTLNNVYFDDVAKSEDIYTLNNYAYFDSNTFSIFAPQSFVEYLEKVAFKNEIQSRLCMMM